jgi:hypothetical protein
MQLQKVSNWRTVLEREMRTASIEIRGADAIENEAEGETLLGLVRALPESKLGFIYVQSYSVNKANGALDILLGHEAVGFLWIEVKGHRAKEVELVASELETPDLSVPYGRQRKHVCKQVESRMFGVSDYLKKVLPKARPAMNWMIAFPNITDCEWQERGLEFDRNKLLLRDDLQDQRLCLAHLQRLMRPEKTRALIDAETCREIRRFYGHSELLRKEALNRPGVSLIKLGSFLDDLEGAYRAPSRDLLMASQIQVADHPLLVRGLAGSGKTLVLSALCTSYVARVIANFPKSSSFRVLVVCHNHSLIALLNERLRRFWDAFQKGSYPERLINVHTMSETMKATAEQVVGHHVSSNDGPSGQAKEILAAISKAGSAVYSAMYHAVFIDEAQDFSHDELKLLIQLVRTSEKGEKTVVIFYDDAQNINGQARPRWKDLELHINAQRSFAMRQCRRSSRQILELGFNVLTGRFAHDRVTTRTFADVNWLSKERLVIEHKDFTEVRFCYFDGLPPEVQVFGSRAHMFSWIAEEVRMLLEHDQVRPEDICIAFRRDKGYEELKRRLEVLLSPAHIAGIVHSFDDMYKRTHQIRQGHITLTSLGRLKGYEAPIVFLIGLDEFGTDSKSRAAFYVGTTRAKHLLYLCGVWDPMSSHRPPGLIHEVKAAARRLRYVNLQERLA